MPRTVSIPKNRLIVSSEMRAPFISLAALAVVIQAQEVYLTTTGYFARPQCTQSNVTPDYHFQPFSYTLNETVR